MALGRTRSLEDVRDRQAGARGIRRGRSGARAAARRALHEQLDDAGAAVRARGAEMVADLAVWLQDHLLTYGFFV